MSFYSRFLYSLLNRIMISSATREQAKKESVVNIELILKENNFQLVDTESFRQKKTVFKVKDNQDTLFILKTGNIEPLQIQLFQIAKLLENKLAFKVPAIIKQGVGWILFEYIDGKPLNDFFEEKQDWCIKVSKKISDDYQLVVQELQKTQLLGNLLADGKEWFFSRLNMWSKPIIDAGLIDFPLIQQLKKEFEEIINKNDADFFGWVHGNIIGDHILVSDENLYLLDLDVVPRIGGKYYDFLRSLDFAFIKSKDEEKVFKSIPKWMKQYLANFSEMEIKLVFAFRNIGILGWDMIHCKAEDGKENVERKKQLALKFIRREY